MADISGATTTTNPNPSQAAEQFTATLTAADGNVTQGLQTLQRVHQARLSLAKRTLAALTAQYGANDPRVKAAQAAVTAKTTTIGKISLVRQQLTAPQVQVNKAGWALQGRVVDATLQPAARFTVFLVDGTKTYQQQYGFAYTDATGYFLISYAGDSNTTGGPATFYRGGGYSGQPGLSQRDAVHARGRYNVVPKYRARAGKPTDRRPN
jgi:hypothetical protein